MCTTCECVELMQIGFRCSVCDRSIDLAEIRLHASAEHTLYCGDCFDSEYAACERCGADCPTGDMTTVDGNDWCPDCTQEHSFTCCDCGDPRPNEEAVGYGDDQLCESCMENYITCEHCNELAPEGDATTVDDETWCPSCRRNHASCCVECDCWTHDDNATSFAHGSLCSSCYEDSYFTCDECNEVYRNDNYGEEGRCEACSRSHNPDSIMDYSTNVLDALGVRVDKKKLLYGIELEVTTPHDRDEAAQECRESLGESYCIAKHDGSLGAGGFELVTIPASLQDHTRRWSDFLDSPPDGLRSWAGGTCGMHVHVSRKPLSLLTIGKLLVFVNAPDNRNFVTGIAGRNSTQWAAIYEKKIADAKKCSSNRYEAINLCNCDTIEFRIFRGTLKKSAFLKNLEFVVASVAFCQVAGIHGLDIPSFLAWLKPVRKDYPNLDAWLVSHGHIISRSKPIKSRSLKGGE